MQPVAGRSRHAYAALARRLPPWIGLFALGLASAGCGKGSDTTPLEFPEGFLFGSATAGFQVEMGCPTMPDAQCVDANSDWYAYVTDPDVRAIERLNLQELGDPAEVGPGHWELYETDYDLARDVLHNNSFRMSIEWSRVFPEPTDGLVTHEELRAAANMEAVEHYRAMLEAMRAHGLTPLVNLHHYTLPLWIHDGAGCTVDWEGCTARGWLDRERTVREIAKYAGFITRELGDLVDVWATQNEPFAVLLSGYLQQTNERSNPPAQVLESEAARAVFLAMVEAHARMVDAVREGDTEDADGDNTAASIGIVHAMAPALPADPEDPLDVQGAQNAFYLWNQLLLDAVGLGELDAEFDGETTHRDDLAGRLDWIGLNYKMSMVVQGTESSILPELSPLLTLNPLTLDLTQVHPRGLYEMLSFLQRRYDKPIYITENNGRQLWHGDHELEARYVVQNLQWIAHAAAQGIDVRGYYYWSFVDNYEWSHGMSVDLGLFAVEPDDPEKTRTPRDIADLYGGIAGSKTISSELRADHPVSLDSEQPTGGVPEE